MVLNTGRDSLGADEALCPTAISSGDSSLSRSESLYNRGSSVQRCSAGRRSTKPGVLNQAVVSEQNQSRLTRCHRAHTPKPPAKRQNIYFMPQAPSTGGCDALIFGKYSITCSALIPRYSKFCLKVPKGVHLTHLCFDYRDPSVMTKTPQPKSKSIPQLKKNALTPRYSLPTEKESLESRSASRRPSTSSIAPSAWSSKSSSPTGFMGTII